MNTYLDRLPLELLELILINTSGLEDLYQCAIVNKFLYKATKPILWHSPWNTNKRQNVTFQVLNNLEWANNHPYQPSTVPFGHYIHKLQFNDNDSVAKILELLTHTPLLEDLSFQSQTLLTDNDMDQVAQLCPRLCKLKLVVLNNIRNRSLESIGRYCSRLRHLTIYHCCLLTPDSLLTLNSTSLEQLKITGDYGWKLNNTAYLTRFHRLTYLSLSTGRKDVCSNTLGDFISGEGILLPLLKELSISGVGNRDSPLDGSFLVPFIKSPTHLERVHVRHCRIDKTTLIAMTNYLPNMNYLSLDHSLGIDTHGLRSLIKECSALAFISLNGSNMRRRRFPETGQRIGRLMALDRYDIERIRLNSFL